MQWVYIKGSLALVVLQFVNVGGSVMLVGRGMCELIGAWRWIWFLWLFGTLLLVGKLWFGAGLLLVDLAGFCGVCGWRASLDLVFWFFAACKRMLFRRFAWFLLWRGWILGGFFVWSLFLLLGASAFVRWGCGSFGFLACFLEWWVSLLGDVVGPCLVLEWWLLLDFACFASLLGE